MENCCLKKRQLCAHPHDYAGMHQKTRCEEQHKYKKKSSCLVAPTNLQFPPDVLHAH